MSRLMTLSELYSLLLHIDSDEKIVPVAATQPPPVLLNQQHVAFWVGPRAAGRGTPTPPQPKAPRQVQVANAVVELMGRFAEARGISATDAWAEAAQHWIAQRQRDVQDLASPKGRALANAVQRSWDTIDDQLTELRAK